MAKVSYAAALGNVEPAAATKIGVDSGVMDDVIMQIGAGTVALGAAAIATAAITTERRRTVPNVVAAAVLDPHVISKLRLEASYKPFFAACFCKRSRPCTLLTGFGSDSA
jgi:hypothetical protein